MILFDSLLERAFKMLLSFGGAVNQFIINILYVIFKEMIIF